MSAYASLPPWQQHFVDLYVQGAHAPNPTSAFRVVRPDVKRPDVASSKLMAQDDIRHAIDERLAHMRANSDLDHAWILSRLQAIAERSMQPLYDHKGRLVRFVGDATNAVRALELLGKHFGMWTDKVGIEGAGIKVVQLVKYYDEDDAPA